MSLMPPQNFRKVQSIHRIGLAADKPSANDVLEGTLYFSTDTLTLERSNGSAWHVYSGSGGSGGNPFDQSLNTTDSPTFVAVTYTEGPLTVHGDEITVLGPATLDDWFDQSVKEGASPIFQNLKVSTLVVDDTNQLEMGGYVLTLTNDVTLPEGGGTLPTDILGRVLISQGAGIPPIFSPDLTLTGTVKAQEVDVIGISGEGALIILKDTSAPANSQMFYIRSQGGGINFIAVDDVGAAKGSFGFYNGALFIRPSPVGGGIVPQIILDKDVNDSDLSYPKIIGGSNQIELKRIDNTDRVILLAKGLGDTPLNADNLTTGSIPDARLSSNVVLENIVNTFTANQVIRSTTPVLNLTDLGSPVNQRGFQIVNFAGDFYIQSVDDTGGSAINTIATNRAGNVLIAGSISERGRTTPLGQWIDVPFSSSNFTSSANSWVVDSGDVISHSYTLIGKTMYLEFFIFNSTTSVPAAELRITIPGGFTVSKTYALAGGIAFDGTTWTTAYISLTGGNSFVALRVHPTGAVNWPIGTNNISVSAMVRFL